MVAISLEDSEVVRKVMAIKEEVKLPWLYRDQMWAKDRSLLAMQYRKRVAPFELVLTNDIPVQHAFSIAILGGKAPQFRLPITLQDQAQRTKMNKSERFVSGVWREADKNHRLAGHNSLLYDVLFFATLGGVCLFPLVVKQPRRQPQFFVYVYDPINCYPDYGEQGLMRFVRNWATTCKDAYSLAVAQGWDYEKLETDLKEDVEITDCWEREDTPEGVKIWNTVICGGAVAKSRTLHDEFERIPIIMSPMNGVPMQPYMDPFTHTNSVLGDRSGSADWGRPVFHMNREIVPTLDRNLTYMAEISRKQALPKYKYVSESGMQTMTAAEFEQTMVLNLAPGEQFEAVQVPTSPRERESIVTALQEKIQQASLSRMAMGMLDLEVSGVTLERATTQARAILEPYLTGAQNVISDTMMCLMAQLKATKGSSKISIATRQAQLGPEMGYLVEDFGKDDIPDTSYLEVTLPMNLPDNRMFKLTMARTAKPGNDPLLPDRFIREDFLEVQDEALMVKLLDEDAATRAPAIIAVKTMAGMRRMIEEWKLDPNRRPEEIEEAMAALAIMRDEFRQVTAPRQQPSTTMQPRQSEPNPAVQSPEESAMPPTQARQVMAEQANIRSVLAARMAAGPGG